MSTRSESDAFDALIGSCATLGPSTGKYLVGTLNRLITSGFTGHDPGGIYHDPRYLRWIAGRGAPVGVLGDVWNALFQRAFRLSGQIGVTVLHPAPVRSRKAIGLTLAGLAAVERRFGGAGKLREIARPLVQCLLDEAHPAGYWVPDFTYSVRGSIVGPDLGEPCVITTCFIVAGLLEWASDFPELRLDEAAARAVSTLYRRLPRHEDERGISFSYHTHARYYVHNANALMAGLAARTGVAGADAEIGRLVDRQIEFVARAVRADGAIPYASEPTPKSTVDNYHTGYVIRGLKLVVDTAPNSPAAASAAAILPALESYYFRTFFQDGLVRRFPARQGIQSHSLAEAMLMLGKSWALRQPTFRSEEIDACERTAARLWRQRDGYFINEAQWLPIIGWVSDTTPMPRWSWAWMFLGIARLAEAEADGGVGQRLSL